MVWRRERVLLAKFGIAIAVRAAEAATRRDLKEIMMV
jgi:hypothetical protein